MPNEQANMHPEGTVSRRRSLTALAAAAFFGVVASAGAASSGPFDGLEGVWGGSGVVTYSSGTRERLRCRVQYINADSDRLSQALRCASDSYNFQINAVYIHQNGKITGSWDEKYLDISGTISGSVADGRITGNLHGPGFLASVDVSTNGSAQTVTIAAEGQEIQQVAVEVRKTSN
jgi:hypothetical protein